MKTYVKKTPFGPFVPFLYLFSLTFAFVVIASFCMTTAAYAAGRDVTLLWDESIDAPYLKSYKVYYYTESQNPDSLDTADYASSYTLVGESPVSIDPLVQPKPITIDKKNTQITLHLPNEYKMYYFVVTAVDTRGLESVPTPEVSSAGALIVKIALNGGAALTNNPTATIQLSADGATQMQFSNDDITWSAAESFAATKTWPLSAGDGLKTVYARCKDYLGNWSNPASASISLDTVRPVAAAAPAGQTYGTAQTVTLSVNESAAIYYTTDGSAPTTSSSVYQTPLSIAADTTVKFFARDLAGNISNVQSQIYVIDTTGPTGSVAINGGAAATNATAAVLTLSATDKAGVTQMQFSSDGAAWTAPEAYAVTKSWTLSGADGVKTIQTKFMDSVGNWSTVYAASITLDTVPPAASATPTGQIYGSAQTVTLSASEPATIYYTTDGTLPTAASSVYQNALLISADATVKFFARDLAGNVSGIQAQTYIIDMTAPTGSIAVDGGVAVTNGSTFSLNLSAADNTTVTQMQFSSDGISWTTPEAYATTKSWTLLGADGAKTIYARFSDGVGNWSSAYSVTVTLDTTAPTVKIGSPSVRSTSAGPATYTITYTGADSISLSNADVSLIKTETANGIVTVSGTGNTTRKVTISNISGNGTLKISIAAGTARDAAGNLAAAAGPSASFTVKNEEVPVYLSSKVTSGNIPGLFVIITNNAGTVEATCDVAEDGTWTSQLLPAGQYAWYLQYGNLLSGKNATVFDTSVLKTLSGSITGLPAGGGVVSVKSETGLLEKTVTVAQDGAYTVDYLVPANDYVVSVVATDVPVTYFDNQTDINNASYVDVSAANAMGVNFTLAVPDSFITGTITDRLSAPGGLTVYGYEVNTATTVFTTTAADGTYALKVKPGTYLVYVVKSNILYYFYKENGVSTQSEAYATTRTVTAPAQTIGKTNINVNNVLRVRNK